MSILSRRYDVFGMLAAGGPPNLWDWAVWERNVDILQDIVSSTRGPYAGFMSDQIDLISSKQHVPFGLMKWSRGALQKWTHASPANSGVSSNWHFGGVQFWCPCASICDKEDRGPDFYFSLDRLEMNKSFGQLGLFCIASDLETKDTVHDSVCRILKVLKESKPTALVASSKRPWGKSIPLGIINEMQFYFSEIDHALSDASSPSFECVPGVWDSVEL